MKELKLDFKCCHGIKKLNYNFDLNNDYLIYAPNGTMKTSFSKTLMDYKNNIDSHDVYFPDRTSVRNINIEDNNPLLEKIKEREAFNFRTNTAMKKAGFFNFGNLF